MSIINFFLRRVFTGTFKQKACTHLDHIQNITPQSNVCQKCVELGDTWPRLRVCLTCGHVGCCEQTKHKHAQKHYQETGHPLMMPLEMDFIHRWMWCYEDNALLELPEQYQ